MFVSCLVFIYILFSSFALADTIIGSSGQLGNSNPTTEEAWLEGLLGLTYNDPSVNFLDDIQANEGGIGDDDKQLTNYDPGFAWDYAIVKYNGQWIAYEDTGNDNLLTTGIFPKGISHVDFFGPQPVPEPATMLLLGSGLIGLWGFRKMFKK